MKTIDDIIANKILKGVDANDWSIWTQNGPCEETMLVSYIVGVGIAYSEISGYCFFPLPLMHLEKCGWVYVGEL